MAKIIKWRSQTLNAFFCSSVYTKIYCKQYFTLNDVAKHNNVNDFWVILNNRVLNLTDYCQALENIYKETFAPLLSLGSQHISYLFDAHGRPKMDDVGVPILEAAAELSQSCFGLSHGLFWWNDPTYLVGRITSCARNIDVIDVNTGMTTPMEVCDEDSIYTIQQRYGEMFENKIDHHAAIWRKIESKCCASGYLHLDKTLAENGIIFNKKIGSDNDNPDNPKLWVFHKDDFSLCPGSN